MFSRYFPKYVKLFLNTLTYIPLFFKDLHFLNVQDEREEVLFAAKKVYDDANEYFEEMKKETEEKRAEREQQWAEKELSEKEKAERAEQR